MKTIPINRRPGQFLLLLFQAIALALLPAATGCKPTPPTIAVIPRTTGLSLWEPEHAGAEAAAAKLGFKVYWNAPTREDDVTGQIALINRIVSKRYAGLILSPDQTLALMTQVRRAIASGVPTVIVGSPLPLEPGGKLSYVLSDDKEAGRMAATRIGTILHGKGRVAIVGINPNIAGVLERVRSFESALSAQYPDVQIVERKMGSFNVPYEQQTTEEVLEDRPHLDAILAVTSDATRGAYSALTEYHKAGIVKLVGCDQDLLLPLTTGQMDSVIAENTYQMGYRAMEILAQERQGKPVPPLTVFEPLLVTKENINDPKIRRILGLSER
jgi:ribose transport system substrate-binding protein